ncbi:MAG TPA: helix-turn-helix transcriptional regulator [Thermoanaerobaculia bacterium]|nr:helix-turn-helix transcriptional regulator [Thermoanaerobaculia bacterium]
MKLFARLGRALKLLRVNQKKTQKLVAARAGITAPMLSGYENERSFPDMDSLDKILHSGLEVSLRELAWALDVVNGRVPPDDLPISTSGAGLSPATPLGELEARLRGYVAEERKPVPLALEEGYDEMLRGLAKLIQAVTAVAQEEAAKPQP